MRAWGGLLLEEDAEQRDGWSLAFQCMVNRLAKGARQSLGQGRVRLLTEVAEAAPARDDGGV